MNVGIMTSFIVGGLLLVSILTLNNQVMQQTTNATMDLMVKKKLDDITDLVINDFNNIGHYYGPRNTPIEKYTSSEFIFWGQVYEDSTGVWDLTNTKVTYMINLADKVASTANPNDFYVTRKVERISGGAVQETHISKLLVVHFELTYYNGNDTAPAQAFLLRSVEVEIICESPEPISFNRNSSPVYQRVFWKKRFYPENLQEF